MSKHFLRIFLTNILVLSATLSAQAAETPNIRPGLWEMTVVAQGLGPNQQTSKTTDCITQEQITDPANLTPKNSRCQIQERDLKYNSFTWKELCEGEENRGTLNFYGDRYQGTVNISGKTNDIHLTIKAKRLGECQ